MKIKFIYLAFLSTVCFSGYAQKSAVASADKKYEKYAYIDAIKTYERVAEKGYKSQDMLQKLGNSYYFNADLENAAKWYGELFAMTQDVEPEYFYRYSQSLKGIGEYDKANEMLQKFNQKSGTDSRGKLYEEKKNYLEEIRKNSGRYKIDNAGINSEYSDYGSAFFGDKVVFTSARDTGNFSKRQHSWTNMYFTNMYVSDLSADGALSAPQKFAKSLNTKFHEATPAFSKDGKTMYFTRNNYNDGKKGKSSDKVTLLKIYKATLEGDKWTNVTELPFNNNNYSVAHPALSPDEKTMYFASDMPGTLGQSDIFKVSINADGSFGTPENLGPKINTPGRESFPFVSDENELYFASDGQLGLGGFDIFVSKIGNDGSIKEVKNIGEPANSKKDDFAYIINSKTRIGFLSSNRDGGNGNDDIYKFVETKRLEFECEQLLAGTITDLETGAILPNTKVTLFDEKFNKLKEVTSDASGKYSFEDVQCGKSYYVRAEKQDYVTKESRITLPNESGETDLPIALEKTVKKVKVGDDLAKAFGIKIIYFDLDKWNIRPDAATDLAKIVDVMKEYPTMKVDVRSHTDSRQTHKYNERLSDRRAKSTIAWMINDGIQASRLSGKGYGETQLVNKCSDGVPCSEEEHQLNRRSEFIITEL
ncbi:OmpA family protein [Flavobacterium lindanitolerans]|uniref:OmpA family protein n=1 Tax=Flavobacterium lindanitolerans TaxID=428988 RepID=UPI0031E040C7